MPEEPVLIEPLFTEQEAAELLRVSARYLRQCKIPTIRFGRRKLYDPKDLKAFKDSMRCQPSTDAETKTGQNRKSGQLISGSEVVSFQEALAAGQSEKPKPSSPRSKASSAPSSKGKASA